MESHVPDYWESFTCLAGACPHTCCAGWEVVVDEETARLYEEVPGPLGEKIRRTLQRDEGEACFPLHGGRCPFLDKEGLCEIHRQLGPEATSVTCREHPRFWEEYGPFQELFLAVSCPAAEALLLGSEEPLRFLTVELPGEEGPGDALLPGLVAVRERLLAELGDRARPLRRRMASCLVLADAAQQLLEEGRISDLPALARTWRELPTPTKTSPRLFPGALHLLESLEILDAEWVSLLRAAETAETPRCRDTVLERMAVYFLFRYLLKAVNDGDLLSQMQFVVLAVLTVERLAPVCGLSDALRGFSREIEHSQSNLKALQEAFWQEAFSAQAFLNELSM